MLKKSMQRAKGLAATMAYKNQNTGFTNEPHRTTQATLSDFPKLSLVSSCRIAMAASNKFNQLCGTQLKPTKYN